MKPNNGGGWGQCFSSFLFVPPCTKITTTRKGTRPIYTQEGEKEQKTRGGEEGVLATHLKGMKMKIDDGGG